MSSPASLSPTRPVRAPRRIRAAAAGVAVVGVLMVSCQKAGTLPEPNSEGAKLFTANCAQCHGMDATGLTGPALVGAGISTEQARAQIQNGKVGQMPAFKGRLSDAEIDTLANYVELLGKQPKPK